MSNRKLDHAQTQKSEEAYIFREFAQLFPFPIEKDASGAVLFQQCNPPAPDICCILESGKELAFELTKIPSLVPDRCNPNGNQAKSSDLYENKALNLKRSLENVFTRECTGANTGKLSELCGLMVTVKFDLSVSKKACSGEIPKLVQLFAQSGSQDMDWQQLQTLRFKTVRAIRYRRLSHTRGSTSPRFNVLPGASCSKIEILGAFKRKRAVEYTTSLPIHLLLWGDNHPVSDEFAWSRTFFDEIRESGFGRFAAIWILERGSPKKLMKIGQSESSDGESDFTTSLFESEETNVDSTNSLADHFAELVASSETGGSTNGT